MQSKLQQYFDANKMYHFEGGQGVRQMERVMREVCGYSNDWGGVMQNFFTDNPGAIQAVMEWIGETNVTEWRENLDNLIEESIEDAE